MAIKIRKMFKQFLLYNFIDFSRRLKETDDKAWFSTSGFISMAFAFNAATVLFVILGKYYPNLKIPSPGFILIGVPWLLFFLLIFLNKSLRNYVVKKRTEKINPKWRLVFWAYYIVTVIIYAYSMSFYSSVT